MQILVGKKEFTGDDELFERELLSTQEKPPSGFSGAYADAGMGASFPRIILQSASAFAIAMSIMGAPSTIDENWPKWKAYFDEVIEFIEENFDDYSIDPETAEVMAIKAVRDKVGKSGNLVVDFRYWHIAELEAFLAKIVPTKSFRITTSAEGNVAASCQIRCRYIFGISQNFQRFTVLVERNGTVSFIEEIK